LILPATPLAGKLPSPGNSLAVAALGVPVVAGEPVVTGPLALAEPVSADASVAEGPVVGVPVVAAEPVTADDGLGAEVPPGEAALCGFVGRRECAGVPVSRAR
jgi:hypothetical protein